MLERALSNPEYSLPAPGAAPFQIEVTRGPAVESRHRVACAVVDAAGATVAAWGDVERPVYPRSSLKPLQALPLVESGAADAHAVSERELSLACASHNGEAAHLDTVGAWLDRIGLGVEDLECGPQWPRREDDLHDLVRAGGAPTRADNNCSGKHTGMLTTALHMGVPTAGYTKLDHPVQRAIFAAIGEIADCDLADAPVGIDGCSAPNPGMPLHNLALAFARFAAPDGLPPERAAACRRIAKAMSAEPFMVAGTGRLCTALMESAAGRIVAKTGAEGVFIAALPEQGLGVALKAEDGATRAAQAGLAAVLDRLGMLNDAVQTAIAAYTTPPLTNWDGLEIGEVRISAEPAF